MKNLLKLCFVLTVFSIFSISCTVKAQQPQKIAYVDADAIIPNMPEYKAAKSELEQYKTILQKQFEGDQAKMQQYYTDVMTKVQQGTLAPAQQKIEEEKLMKMQEELQKKGLKMEEDLAAKEQSLTKPMYDKFNEALKTLAKSNSYAYILDKKLLLYSEGGEDATPKMKAQLGVQ